VISMYTIKKDSIPARCCSYLRRKKRLGLMSVNSTKKNDTDLYRVFIFSIYLSKLFLGVLK
jgi:hypothetical protein